MTCSCLFELNSKESQTSKSRFLYQYGGYDDITDPNATSLQHAAGSACCTKNSKSCSASPAERAFKADPSRSGRSCCCFLDTGDLSLSCPRSLLGYMPVPERPDHASRSFVLENRNYWCCRLPLLLPDKQTLEECCRKTPQRCFFPVPLSAVDTALTVGSWLSVLLSQSHQSMSS